MSRLRRFYSPADAFPCHGVELVEAGDQAVGDCFACGKANHLYVSVETGMWDCKVCGESGNVTTFLRHVHETALAATSRTDYAILSEDRSLPQNILRSNGVAVLPTGDWLLPAHSTSGGVINLRRYDMDHGRVFQTWGVPPSVIGLAGLSVSDRPVWVCEGEWDYYAALWVREVSGHPVDVIGIPGAASFKSAWRRFLAGRDVVLMMDNDDPGRAGVKRTLKILQLPPKPKSVAVLEWPKETPSSYDVRDLLSKGVPC